MTNDKLYIFFGIFITLFFLALAGFSGGDIGAGRLRIGTAYINDSTSGFITINKGLIANGDYRVTGNIELDATNKVLWQSSAYGDALYINGNGGEISYSATTHKFFGLGGVGEMFSIDSATQTNTNTNFTKLGSDAPAIKEKLITGVLPAVNNNLTVAHGIADWRKIISVDFLIIEDALARHIKLGYQNTLATTVGFSLWVTSTNVVYFVPLNSTDLPGDTAKFLIKYTQ